MSNYFEPYDWNRMMNQYPPADYNISEYHKILSPEVPLFLDKYLELDIIQRLKGIGLLCGTDWTKLYKNRFYYSRYDHSLGVALIIWHFTKDKAQTIAGLLHDVSTPVFSHVTDFRRGDALTQTATEETNSTILQNDAKLLELLQEDNLKIYQVQDYHKYSVADNEIPRLSADRLEYMFPSGMALDGSWDLHSIYKCYNDISIMKNEDNKDELGFNSKELAEFYCEKFCMISHILQLNENKLTLQLLGQIMNTAVHKGILKEEYFMKYSETEILDKIEIFHREFGNIRDDGGVYKLYRTFRKMTSIEHTDKPLDSSEYFCVSLNVKQRYVDPLVMTDGKPVRLSTISDTANQLIHDFLSYKDTAYGCVKLNLLNP